MGVDEQSTEISPHRFVLYPNYPNPFNSQTVVRYDLSEQSDIQLNIYNVLGGKIKTWHFVHQQRGNYKLVWDGTDSQGSEVSSGVYFAVLSAGVNKQVIQKNGIDSLNSNQKGEWKNEQSNMYLNPDSGGDKYNPLRR